ncbi:MAG: hypothetical protein CR996_00140 [Draconibacterium sp.]|nr:MAG: hypothetical protein CR996_00140 [Draconibacterium sp.]PIF05093.1 MAG: hypothetical protein CSA36_08535 [Draconibacterium sp.]
MKKLIILLLIPAQLIYAQNEITLERCYQLARENYPNLHQTELLTEISRLQKENIATSKLPQVMLNAQATYQSEVTHIDFAIPSISIPSISKNQYKAYAEFRQSIWDGGISAASASVEDAVLQSNLNQLEVEAYKLNEQVAQAFFTAMATNRQEEVLLAHLKVLQEQLKTIKSGIENQMVEPVAKLVIEAEIVNIEQQQMQLKSGKNAALGILSVLTGKKLLSNVELIYTEDDIKPATAFSRPEFGLFSTRKAQLEKQSLLLVKKRNPKIFGFGQAGYGRPGLNLLRNKFDTYYLVGAGISWNAFDWKNSVRQQKMLQFQSQIIDRQEETFKQNLNLLLVLQQEQINQLKNLLKTDKELENLRTEIARSSASKFKNGTLTSAEYIKDMQAKTIAKLNSEVHKVQLLEAIEKYNLIKGKACLK